MPTNPRTEHFPEKRKRGTRIFKLFRHCHKRCIKLIITMCVRTRNTHHHNPTTHLESPLLDVFFDLALPVPQNAHGAHHKSSDRPRLLNDAATAPAALAPSAGGRQGRKSDGGSSEADDQVILQPLVAQPLGPEMLVWRGGEGRGEGVITPNWRPRSRRIPMNRRPSNTESFCIVLHFESASWGVPGAY